MAHTTARGLIARSELIPCGGTRRGGERATTVADTTGERQEQCLVEEYFRAAREKK
jgi:hypothetical protein